MVDQTLISALFGGPSWLDRVRQQTQKDLANYLQGGVPALMSDTQGTQDLMGGFGGTTTGKVGKVPSGMTSEDFALRPDLISPYRSPAMLWKGMVLEGHPMENHAMIAERHGFPNDMIPGFVTHEGQFHYQYPEDIGQ